MFSHRKVPSSAQKRRNNSAPTVNRTTSDDGQAYTKRLHNSKNGNNFDQNTPILKSFDVPVDPECDPEKPKVIQFSEISAAAFNLKNGIERTPCTKSNQLSRLIGVDLYCKKEFLQVTGSFKERGARYALLKLTPEQQKLGVIAASAGNHALALSYHGKQLHIPVTVIMPIIAPLMKINMCRSYEANVIVDCEHIGEAKELALHMAEKHGLKYINGYDHPDVLAGQGTIGLELLEQMGNVDAVIVPVGGGGLIAGIAMAVKTLSPSTILIGVESESCPSFQKAIAADRPVRSSCGSTLADGLSVPIVGCNALATARGLVDKLVTVSEQSIALAILRLIEVEKAVVEGAGAVGIAALLAGQLPELAGKRVVTILCGSNIDTSVLGRTIERGLAADGRLNRFEVIVTDRPGVAELVTLVCKEGASTKDIFHERAWLKTDVFSVRVKMVVETRDKEHAEQLEAKLRTRYSHVNFNP